MMLFCKQVNRLPQIYTVEMMCFIHQKFKCLLDKHWMHVQTQESGKDRVCSILKYRLNATVKNSITQQSHMVKL